MTVSPVVRCLNAKRDRNHSLQWRLERNMSAGTQPVILPGTSFSLPEDTMEKIPAVETAKSLMTEAIAWSVMKWLRQKKNVRKIADDEARRARMDAEETFDIAEKQLSTALAREGCRKAIHSWELHEKAIRRAEALIHAQ